MTMLPPPSRLRLAALPNAVGSARRHTRDLLPRWDLAALTDTAELVVSELVTNAVKAVGATRPLTTVELRLVPTRASVFIEVWDPNPAPPTLKEPSWDAESGRGLPLVDALSARWNVAYPRRGGKVVWCEVRADHD